jgi:hypothetical protein
MNDDLYRWPRRWVLSLTLLGVIIGLIIFALQLH